MLVVEHVQLNSCLLLVQCLHIDIVGMGTKNLDIIFGHAIIMKMGIMFRDNFLLLCSLYKLYLPLSPSSIMFIFWYTSGILTVCVFIDY